MSEFLRRWSTRKLAQEESLPEGEMLPDVTDPAGGDQPELCQEADGPAADTGSRASPLPDRETLRALFRTQQPDGLDDYTQDFTRPELLSPELVATLRGWAGDLLTREEDRDILAGEVGQIVPAVEGEEPPVGS